MQKFLFPMKELRVTQKALSTYSHAGSLAMDFGGKDTGVSPLYAPCDLVVKRTRSNANGEMYVESTEPVLFADGTTDYARLILIHAPTFLYNEGDIIPQGAHFYDEGGMGSGNPNAFAKHVHIEGGKGKWINTIQTVNAQRTYCIENQYNLEKMFIVPTDTTIMDGQGYNWVIDSSTPTPTPSTTVKTIDISKHQTSFNGATCKSQEIAAVFCRAAYAETKDSTWNKYTKETANNGMLVGSYQFVNFHYSSLVGNDFNLAKEYAIKQCDKYIEILNETPEHNTFVALDLELEDSYNCIFSTQQLTDLANFYMDRLFAAGYQPLLYASASWIKGRMIPEQIKYPWWVAYYYNHPNAVDFSEVSNKTYSDKGTYGAWMQQYSDKVAIWQFTSVGYADKYGATHGTNGLDKNFAYVDLNLKEVKPVPTENKILQVNLVNGKLKTQAFNSKDVNDWYTFEDDSVYLPIGEYEITYMEDVAGSQGFKWCKIAYNKIELWCVYNISDNRCTVVDNPTPEPTPTPDPECDCKKLKTQLVALGQEVSRLQSENNALQDKINKIKEII